MYRPLFPNPTPEWRLSPAGKRDIAIHIRLDRHMLAAAIFSILIHIVLFITYQKHQLEMQQAAPEAPPIVMELSLEKPLIKPPQPAPLPVEPPTPLPRKPHPVRTQNTAKPPEAPKVMSAEASPLRLPAESPPTPKPAAPAPAPTSPGAPTDMMSYMAMMRERRRQAEAGTERDNAEAAPRERAPTEDERRNEIIKRNLQTGTSGIFTIINLAPSHAQFIFRGWTTSASNARSEVIQVEAMPDEDIKRKIVQKMIEIIRRHYSGNFNWDSQRLQRVVVLSARPEDNDGLEDFIMAEFF